VEHVTDDTLERYAMRFLPAPESDRLEEHLLICSACRDRLTATEEYVAAMRSAAAKIRRGGKGG
jgi:anti-sigma factor RsiW